MQHIAHHELTTPRRFTEAWEADASLALRTGDPTSVDGYAEHGRLHTAHPALLARHVADVHRRQTAKGRSVAITTTATATARAINQAIQARQPHRSVGPAVVLADGTRAYLGDQITSRRNDPALRTTRGEQVRNRHTWTLDAVSSDGDLTVSHPERGTAVLPAAYASQHAELGWAVTGYGNQGDTVDVGIAILEPGTTRNHAYVALTRGRHTNHAWIPDPTGTTDPSDYLASIITRAPDHESALATHGRLHIEAGLSAPPPGATFGKSPPPARSL